MLVCVKYFFKRILHKILIVFKIPEKFVGWKFCAHISLGNAGLNKVNIFRV